MPVEYDEDYTAMSRRGARKSLVSAALAEDLTLMDKIIKERPDVIDARDSYGDTPISQAIMTNNLKPVMMLIEAGADPLQHDHDGFSLMDGAAYWGAQDIALYLRDQGCKWCVSHAAALGDLNFIETSARQTAQKSLHEIHQGATALHHAAHANQTEVIDYLLSHGVRIEVIDRHGHTPLALAVERSAFEACQVLLVNGANPNVTGGHSGGSVLHRAIITGSAPIAGLLLEHGADPNARDGFGKTPLRRAVEFGAQAIIEVLRNYPVDLL